ncbi:hypothetical protein NY547_05945 [Cnuibacter physcomitrellae]|nr:hypothetical protein [Cnuibacter physcomitrellae]MCS5496781.1 hypothetical protein [Cnuibacter physcomitrellae]
MTASGDAAPVASQPERPLLTLLGAPDAVACEGDACALPPR